MSQPYVRGGENAAGDPVRRGPRREAEPDTGRTTPGADPGAAGAAGVRGTGRTVGGAAGHRPRARGAVRGHRMDPGRLVADLRARDAGRGPAAGPVEPLPGPRRRGRDP